MAIKLNPYLNFSGNTKEVMDFYKSVFGGELTVNTFSSYPQMEVPEGYADKIMHSQLVADEMTIMASDAMTDDTAKPTNASLSLSGDHGDGEKLTKIFNDLAAGGQITQPLEKQVWGDTFGMLVDKFGVTWMVNIAQA